MSESDNETQKPNKRNHQNRSIRPHQKEGNTAPKHMRLRYWSSYEDMRLVEMWLRHRDEVESLSTNHPQPIFRTISEGMKECGFHVNAQECRRKIHSLNTKFIAERQHVNKTGIKSSWRLYPLILSLHEPMYKKPNPKHQEEILTQLLDKLSPHLPTDAKLLFHPYIPKPIATVDLSNPPLHDTLPLVKREKFTPNDEKQQIESKPNTAVAASNPYKRAYTPRRKTTNSTLRQMTEPRLTQLRADNAHLIAQRDAALQRLIFEEREYKLLESFITDWQRKHKAVLQQL